MLRRKSAYGYVAVILTTVLLTITREVAASENAHGFGESRDVHDEAHLKMHLENKIDVSQMTKAQQRFYYFSMNDLNKDNKIDGTEILKALNHDHEHGEMGPGVPVVDEESMSSLVDIVLKDSDYNGDGFIDYAEYTRKQDLQESKAR